MQFSLTNMFVSGGCNKLQGKLSPIDLYKENWASGKYTGVSLFFRSDWGLVQHACKRNQIVFSKVIKYEIIIKETFVEALLLKVMGRGGRGA